MKLFSYLISTTKVKRIKIWGKIIIMFLIKSNMPGSKQGKINVKAIYFSMIRNDFVSLIKKIKFQRFAHILLKAVAIIEKDSLKFSGLPVYRV